MANNVLIGTSSTWTTASNWSTGSAPTTGDIPFLTNNSTIINGSLNQSTVALSSMNQDMSFTGQVGINAASGNTYLQIVSPVTNLGKPPPSNQSSAGTRLFNWNAGTTSSVCNVMNTANSGASSGNAPIKLLGSALTINLTNGIISVAAFPAESSTITLNVANGNLGVAPQAYLGPGCVITALSQESGVVTSASQSVVTTALVARSGAALSHIGTGGFATLEIDSGGKVSYAGSGSINTLTITGSIDLSGGGSAVAVGTINVYGGAKISDPLGRLTFGSKNLIGCSMSDVTIDLGNGRIF